MNSKQAARRLKVSVRSLQRLATKHKLTVLYQRGKSGKQEAVYAPDEIDRLRETLATPTERTQPDEEESTALAPTLRDSRGMAQLVALAQTIQATGDPRPVWLTRAQAIEISGLPESTINQAIREGKLKPSGRGRGWRIFRDEVLAFSRSLYRRE